MNIQLQTQPTKTTCVHTCLAMLMGIPASDVVKYYGEQGFSDFDKAKALDECGIIWNRFVHGTMAADGWYLATVASLNMRGYMHCILIHYKLGEGMTIYDPAQGEKYKSDGSDLYGWCNLYYIRPGGKLPKGV